MNISSSNSVLSFQNTPKTSNSSDEKVSKVHPVNSIQQTKPAKASETFQKMRGATHQSPLMLSQDLAERVVNQGVSALTVSGDGHLDGTSARTKKPAKRTNLKIVCDTDERSTRFSVMSDRSSDISPQDVKGARYKTGVVRYPQQQLRWSDEDRQGIAQSYGLTLAENIYNSKKDAFSVVDPRFKILSDPIKLVDLIEKKQEGIEVETKLLGRGGHAKAFLVEVSSAKWNPESRNLVEVSDALGVPLDTPFVVKEVMIKKSSFHPIDNNKYFMGFMNEHAALQAIGSHPEGAKGIPRYYGVAYVTSTPVGRHEKVGFSLMEHLPNPVTEMSIKDIIDVVKTLKVAHELNLTHGDIHRSNFMRSADGSVKVLDWGSSVNTSFKEGAPYLDVRRQFCSADRLKIGDLESYNRAKSNPERFKAIMQKADVYALGMTILDLFLPGKIGNDYWEAAGVGECDDEGGEKGDDEDDEKGDNFQSPLGARCTKLAKQLDNKGLGEIVVKMLAPLESRPSIKEVEAMFTVLIEEPESKQSHGDNQQTLKRPVEPMLTQSAVVSAPPSSPVVEDNGDCFAWCQTD